MERKQQKSSLWGHEEVLECKQQPRDFSLSDVPLAINKQTNKHIHSGMKARTKTTKASNL